jgi:hypothetical protein
MERGDMYLFRAATLATVFLIQICCHFALQNGRPKLIWRVIILVSDGITLYEAAGFLASEFGTA